MNIYIYIYIYIHMYLITHPHMLLCYDIVCSPAACAASARSSQASSDRRDPSWVAGIDHNSIIVVQ